jgi:hypothetical protein
MDFAYATRGSMMLAGLTSGSLSVVLLCKSPPVPAGGDFFIHDIGAEKGISTPPVHARLRSEHVFHARERLDEARWGMADQYRRL